jgi:hypothetical protein
LGFHTDGCTLKHISSLVAWMMLRDFNLAMF